MSGVVGGGSGTHCCLLAACGRLVSDASHTVSGRPPPPPCVCLDVFCHATPPSRWERHSPDPCLLGRDGGFARGGPSAGLVSCVGHVSPPPPPWAHPEETCLPGAIPTAHLAPPARPAGLAYHWSSASPPTSSPTACAPTATTTLPRSSQASAAAQAAHCAARPAQLCCSYARPSRALCLAGRGQVQAGRLGAQHGQLWLTALRAHSRLPRCC